MGYPYGYISIWMGYPYGYISMAMAMDGIAIDLVATTPYRARSYPSMGQSMIMMACFKFQTIHIMVLFNSNTLYFLYLYIC